MLQIPTFRALLLVLAVSALFSSEVRSQTVLVDPAGAGGFENGTDLPSNGWTVVNSTTATPNRNAWFVGSIGLSAGLRGAYISNSTTGLTNSYYKSTAQVSHFYRDVVIPTGATNIQISFKWRTYGESTYDFIKVYHVPTTLTPAAGTQITVNTNNIQLGTEFSLVSSFQTFSGTIANTYAGTTRRLVFSWRNDGSGGTDPAGSIDEVKVTCDLPCSTVTAGTASTTTPTITCSGAPSLSLTSGTTGAGMSYQWQSRLVGTTTWANVGSPQTTTTFDAPSISASTEYQVISTCSNGGATNTSTPVTVTVNTISVSPVTSTICQGSSQALAVTVPAGGAQTFLNATFNSGTDGFTLVNSSTGGTNSAVPALTLRPNNYSLTATGGPYVFTPGSQFLLSDADNAGNGIAVNVRATSPVINTAGATSLSLSFRHCLKYLNASTSVKVEVYNGTAWTQVALYTSTQGTPGAFSSVGPLNILTYANANMQVRFTYLDAWGYFWALDDVVITGTIPTTLAWTSSAGGGLPTGAGTPSTTNNNISVTPTATGALTYTVNSNNCGTAVATVNVNPAVSITGQPTATQALCVGSGLTLSVTASNAANYQWYRNSAPISGATGSTYTVASTTTTDAGTYYVIIGGNSPCGSVQSGNAVVNISTPPSITGQPTGTTLCAGTALTLSVTASNGTGYQWYLAGNPISGATAATYSVASVTSANAGDYYCVVTANAPCANATSNTVTVNVTNPATVTTQPPATTGVCQGGTLTLAVTATGVTSYQWYFNSAPISGATSPTYSVGPVTSANAGTYYLIMGSNSPCGIVQTMDYVVNITPNPTITTQPPASVSACAGSALNITVVAANAPSYQWYLGGNPIPGATSATYNVPSSSAANQGIYYVVAIGNNGCGTIQSNNSFVTVTQPATITTQPAANTTLCTGSALNLNVSANNAAGYQWYKNSTIIPGATSAIYNVSSSTSTDAGTYYVIVTANSPCVNTGSNSAVVNITTPATITTQPAATQTVCSGSALTLTVAGANATNYQWYRNSIAIAGATSATYSVASATTANSGTYYVVLGSNSPCAATTSNNSIVTVNPKPTAVITANTPTTICNGQFASMNVAFTGTGPWTFTRTNGTTPVTETVSNNPYTFFFTPTATTTYSITALNDANCTASAADYAGTATIVVKPRPTAAITVSGANPICNGSSTTINVTLTGTGPWNFNYSNGTTNTQVLTGTSPYTVTVSPSANTTYSINVLQDANCIATAADYAGNALVTVRPRPTAVLSITGASTLCNGGTTTMSVAFTGTAPWTFTRTDGTTPTTVTTSSNPYTFTASPSTTTTYSITGLNDQYCTAIAADYAGSQIVNVNARPTASITGATTVCNGTATNISVALTGTGPWTMNYTNGTTTTSVTASSSPYVFSVSPSATTTYSISSLQDLNCTSIAADYAGSATVTVNPRPTATVTVSGVSTICDGTNTNVNFALTGSGPWNFTYSNGTTTNTVTTATSPYTINVSPSTTTTYSVTALNDVNCTASTSDISSTATVTVHARPTATLVANGATTICNGTTLNMNVNLTGTGPWTFDYMSGSTPTSVTTSTNPYSFNVTPNTNTTYSIVYLQDAYCLGQSSDYSTTVPVTVNYEPVITSQPQSVTECSGVGTSLTVGATGTAITYQWMKDGVNVTDGGAYTGSNTNTLNISSITGTSGNYQVVISGTCPPVATSNTVSVTEDHNNIWSGAVNQNWSVTGNWSCGTIPIVTTNVLIPTNATNMPLVDIPGAICNSITIDPSASVMFTGVNNGLEIKTSIIHNGVFDASLGTVILSGTSAQNIPAITYKNLQVDGGSAKTLEGNATVTGILNLIDGHILIGAYDLALDAPAQTAGGSANSFIVTNDTGVVIGKNMGVGGNPDAAMFHVGITTNSYTPIMLENLGTADDYSVRVIPNVYEDGYGVDPMTVTNPVVDRTWLVDEAVPGGSYVNMNPYWNTVNEINGFDQTHVYVTHYTGGEWIGLTDSALGAPAAGISGGMFYADADSIQSFSPFAVASIGQFPLAIKLADISATNVGNRNRVNFSSASEDEGDIYNIERSVDGKVFAQIGTVKANGKASAYTYWDQTPVTGKNYYRLRLEAKGANTTYSKIVSAIVKGGDAIFSINAYPNPVEGKVSVTVNGDIAGKGTITVTDMSGRVVRTAQQITGNNMDIDLSSVAQGLYFIKYSDDVHNESIKINKK